MASSGHDSVRPAAFPQLLLDMAQERNLDTLLNLIVQRLHSMPSVALARIWLIAPGDICPGCHLRDECPDQTACLHLVASAGSSRRSGEVWSGMEGRFRRFPIGVRKVGHIAATGESVELTDIDARTDWIARPEWTEAESIRSFTGHPLSYRGDILGVLAVFTRESLLNNFGWSLRLIADHAASAIANARAFEEIESLRVQLQQENEHLRDEVREAQGCGDIVGRSQPLRNVLEQVELVAPTQTSVLVLGETGTGKELVARAVHEGSPRSEGPLIKVNCASIPSELFESEFFGHLAGSFTGAIRDRAGRFELAHNGTLFLDEVAEIPLEMQGKLLRVLQEQTFERIGEETSRRADVRVVAATNRDLKTEMEEGRFRQDLYYRLSVFPIELPPLRDRLDDLELLATHFLRMHSRRLGIPQPRLRLRDIALLENYSWPGNIRELGNVIERAIITSRAGPLRFQLPDASSTIEPSRATLGPAANRLLSDAEVRELERENLLAVLEETNWKVSGPGGAARYMGLHPATLTSRMRAMGLLKRRSGASG